MSPLSPSAPQHVLWTLLPDTLPLVILDGAHNLDAAQRLRDYLVLRKEKEIHFVFGAVRDKNIREIGAHLFPVASSIHLTPLTNSRTSLPGEIADMHKKFNSRMMMHSNMRQALRAAWKQCSPEGLVVATGSLYLVGELLPIVQKYAKIRSKVECQK